MKYLIYLISLALLILLQSCDMDLQRSYDFDDDAHWIAPEPYTATIYEYITQEGAFDQNNELDSMAVAIQRAEMEDVYKAEGDDKTVLLLRNEAIIEFLNDYGYNSINEVPVSTLENLLQYHIVTDRLKQRDMNIARWYTFQTLLDGEDGLINLFVHNEYWEIHINGSGAPNLPPTAKAAVVYYHNFEFSNGVAHQLRSYTMRAPFE